MRMTAAIAKGQSPKQSTFTKSIHSILHPAQRNGLTGRHRDIGRAKRHEHGRPKGLECEWRRRLRKGKARSNRLLQNLCTASYIQRKVTGSRADTEASDGLGVMSMKGRKASDIHAEGSVYEKAELFRSSGSSRISQSLAAGSSASPKP